MKGDEAVRDIINLPDNGHLYAAHVINDLWRETNGDAIIATDVGQHQMWEAQYYKHDLPRTLITSGGLGTMGFALPAAIGAKVGAPRQGRLGHRRRRRLPDDGGRALHRRAGEPRHQHRRHQQRLPRHGPPVAGGLLRQELFLLAHPVARTSSNSPKPTASRASPSASAARSSPPSRPRANTRARS